MASSKLTVKLLIDKTEQRVLFAEAGKDFIDFLFSLLALPIGTVIKLLDNRDMDCAMVMLYKSVSDLNDDYIQSDQQKDVLLKPKLSLPFLSPQVPLLSTEDFQSPSSTPDSATRFYNCSNCKLSIICYTKSRTQYPYCSRIMAIDDRYVLKSAADAKGGGFVKGLVAYMVMDDLVVSPMSTITSITLLSKFNVKDLGDLEEKTVHIGLNEGLELLKHSLSCKTVLTNVFLRNQVNVKDDN